MIHEAAHIKSARQSEDCTEWWAEVSPAYRPLLEDLRQLRSVGIEEKGADLLFSCPLSE